MDSHQREILSSIFTNHYPLSHASMDKLLNACEIKEFRKGECFSVIGKHDMHEYFVLEGIAHRNVINDQGDIISTGFYLAKSVITPHFARTINGKSIFNLEALTIVTLSKMPVKILDSLRYSYDDIRSFGLKVVEQELLTSLSNEIAYRSMSAKGRLLAFRERYPNLENLIPHTVIASYLGITPVSFSRLRNELAKG